MNLMTDEKDNDTEIESGVSTLIGDDRPDLKRLAILTLKVLKINWSGGGNEEDVALALGATPFEARYIALSCYWSNDQIDLCFEGLGIPMKDGAYNSTTKPAWYAWFCETVDALVLEPIGG